MLARSALLFAVCALAAAAPTDKTVTLANGVPATLSASAPSSGAKVQVAQANQGSACPNGGLLTYGIKTGGFAGSLAKCQARLGNWTAVAPGKLVKKSGTSAVGATRVWNTTDSALQESTSNSETLTAVFPPTSGNSNLEQRWSNGKEVYNTLTLFSGSHSLTVQGPSNGKVSLQYYINTCASDQNKAYPTLSTILQDAVNFWIAKCQA